MTSNIQPNNNLKIAVDNNILVFLASGAEHDLNTLDRSSKVTHIKERVKTLLDTMTRIYVPAPAWAEFLSKADRDSEQMQKLVKNRKLVILPFDQRSAHEAATVQQLAIPNNDVRQKNCIKVDRMIIGLCKVHAIDIIYTADQGMKNDADRSNLACQGIESIEIDPKLLQENLEGV